MRPSHQPAFASPEAGGGGEGETGEVGDLFADMPADNGGGGDENEGNSQHTATNIDAVMAEFGQGGGGGDEEVSRTAEEKDSNDDQHTAINMDSIVAELGHESSGGGGGRRKRRETADKDGLESLFGSSAGSPAPSSALDHTESPGSGSSVAGDDGADRRGGGVEDATAEVAGSWAAITDTPEPALYKKDKRRETADASDLQGLLFGSPEGGVASPSPAAEGFCSPAAAVAPPQQQRQGSADSAGPSERAAEEQQQPSPLGAAEAAATPGSERSSATAVSMRGVLELASPPAGAPADVDVRDAAEEEEYVVGVGGVAVTTPQQHDGRFGGSEGGGGGGGGSGSGGKDSGRTAGNGSVLGLLDSTPSPGGGLDQSVADGSALRGRSLARMYDSSSGGGGSSRGGSSIASAKDSVSEDKEPLFVFLTPGAFGDVT